MRNSSLSETEVFQMETNQFELFPLERIEQNQFEFDASKHTQKTYEVIWIQEGSGIHIIDQTKFRLSNNRIYCAVPGQRHQLTVDAGSKGYVISFSESYLNYHYNEYSTLYAENIFHHLLQCRELTITNAFAGDMQEIILLLLKETKNNFALRTEALTKYLKIFLIFLRRQLETASDFQPMLKNNSLEKHFFWLLENNFKEKKAVSQYAKELCVSPNHLNHVIKNTTGFSARHHIQQRIVREAKMKAYHTGASMKEIAYYLGFDDLAHFSKFFKNTSGINFTDFKKETRHLYA
jgi:AraC family transcriptional activator of pobA